MPLSKNLFNQIRLAYAPLTSFEFAKLKKDADINEAIKLASLYLIAQRPVISFENFVFNTNKLVISFEIHQKENPVYLKCELPLFQENIGLSKTDSYALAFNFFDEKNLRETTVINDVHSFSILKEIEGGDEFKVWFSPEKLLFDWLRRGINCMIQGDYKAFLSYDVHYVGKATKQSILKRLNGHPKLQDVLSLERPRTKGQYTANEVVILMFEFKENLQHEIISEETPPDKVADIILGKNYPSQETIFLEAEKALIKAMQPKYNEVLFGIYPKSDDGLYSEKINNITFTFVDPLTLKYPEGSIMGGLSLWGGDSIKISEGNKIELVKVKG